MIRHAIATVVAIAACAHSATSPAPYAQSFADAFASAIAARDARAVAARFTSDAEICLIAGPALHGRDAITHGFDALFARFANARVLDGLGALRHEPQSGG